MPRPKRKNHKWGERIDGVLARQHPLYNTWAGMIARCYDDATPTFKNYGGRGVLVTERWHHFKNFVSDMGAKPSSRHSLERIDNFGDYGPANCKWATPSEQCVNRRLFKNSKSRVTGVLLRKSGRYEARFDFEGSRYLIGHYDTLEEAASARVGFVELFMRDKPAAEASVSGERVWCTSSTKVRGVTCASGAYIVRVTVAGVRHYVGHYKNLDEAVDARRKFIEAATRGT